MLAVETRSSTASPLRVSPGVTSRLNLAADVTIVFAATFTACGPWRFGAADLRTAFWIATAAVSTWVVTAAALRYYSGAAYQRSPLDDLAMTTVQVAAVSTVLLHIGAFMPAGTPAPRIPYLLCMVWVPAALLRRLLPLLARRERPVEDVLIVGIGPIARLTAQDLRRRRRHRIAGHVRLADENGRETKLLKLSYQTDGAACEILGGAEDLEKVLRTVAVDEVYVAGKVRTHGEEMQQAIAVCEKFGIPFALPASAFRLERARPIAEGATSDGYLHYETHESRPQALAMKRLFDIASSAFALWLLLPVFLTVAALIKLTSRGPVFFKQVRVGLHGRTFNMLKFRSMVVDAEQRKAALLAMNEQTGPVFKLRCDPRVTRVGRFIRKYSVDELPQLINVLRGDMSVVGPRPPVPDELAKYEAWQRRRLSVRPGLTCIWQVSGRNQISFDDWMVLDMQYIDHWTLARDFDLIFRTIPVVITGRGAS